MVMKKINPFFKKIIKKMTKILLVSMFFIFTRTEVVNEVIADTVICKSNECRTEGISQSTKVTFSLEQDKSAQEKKVEKDKNLYFDIGSGSKKKLNGAFGSTTELSASLKEKDNVTSEADEVQNIFLTTDTVDIKFEISSSLKGNKLIQPQSTTDSVESIQGSIVTEIKPLEVTSENSFKTNTFSIKQDFSKNFMKNTSHICLCDFKVNECDINCCCDEDCSANMKEAFSFCSDFEDISFKNDHNSCFSPEFTIKESTENLFKQNKEGLFCLIKRNLPVHLQYKESQIVKNITYFKKNIRHKIFTYSQVHTDEPNIVNASYQGGDYVWSVVYNRLVPFGVPDYHFNMECNSMQYIHFLSDFSTKCLHYVPKSKIVCEKSEKLGMKFYLKHSKVVRSPSLIKNSNSSNISNIKDNETYCDVIPYICPTNSILNCSKGSPRTLEWESNTCKNIVKSVVYYIYHNGSQGIAEVRAYFFLANVSSKGSSLITQEIKLKFLWVNTTENRFVRSGNPGYLVGKPIMAGKKIFSYNDTNNVKKEAIDLLLNPKHWLSVFGNEKGICNFNERIPVNFGENAVHNCFIAFNKYDLKKKKCADLQEDIFHFFLGSDYIDIKLNNKLNKFVGTFGNSRVEETGDWVEVIIDLVPIVSSQTSFTSFHDIIICKDLITDFFIDIAYSKIGSFERPQYKVIGVNFFFGSPKKLMYSDSLYYMTRKTFKISTFVNFIDLTTQPENAFAEIPGLEAKFPHDFFYPFFSRAVLITQSSVATCFVLYSLSFLINYFRFHVLF